MIQPNFTEKIECPCKNGGNAFRDSFDKIEVSLCSTCGLMTTSKYLEDSDFMENIKNLSTPELLQISILDENGFRWFPSVIPFSKKGVIYAEPRGKNDFKWFVAPIVKVSEAEGHLYLNPDTNRPFENRIATEKAVIFDKTEFIKVLEMSNLPQSNDLLIRINSIFNN
jgi:hypothetical protein